jgi:hypothetical protein
MARFATTDPSLSSLAADRRQRLSLIAPPNAKRRRTIKKVLVEVRIFSFLDHRITLFLINHACAFSDQSPTIFSSRTCQCPIHWYDLHCPPS